MRRSFCFSRSCAPYSDRPVRRSPFTPPGGTCSLHLLSSGLAPLLRNRSVPSRRDSLHLGPIYRAISTSDAPLLGRTTTVMRDRRDVFDAGDLQAAAVERAHRGLATGARTTNTDFDVLQAVFLRGNASLFGGDLRSERRALARAAEAATTRGRPGQRVALTIRDRDDRVVERRMDVRDSIEHVLASLLRLFRS